MAGRGNGVLGQIEPWFWVAVACNMGGYASYLAGLRRKLVDPNRASWLIWSAATTIEALTYGGLNGATSQGWVLLMSALLCIGVTLAVWRRSAWAPPSTSESVCMTACLAALVLWVAFQEAYWAHLLVVLAVPVSFWPTWASVVADRTRERSPAWGLWTIGDLATLLVTARGGGAGDAIGIYGYLVVELVCHASVWLMIGLSTINPLRSLGTRHGGFYVLDAYKRTASMFSIGETHLGKAVFAAAAFTEGQALLEFTGRRFRTAKVRSLMRGGGDRYVQVTPDHYMGPSGRIDDLVNHSCNPNAGLRFAGDGVFLVAIRDIAPGEEVTWDYSTTLTGSNWHMLCQCRSAGCRRVIGNFETLAPVRQEWFRARNLVAPYLRRRDSIEASMPMRQLAR